MCMNVDLPEPDGPVTATNWPGSMSSVTPRSARTMCSPILYSLVRSLTDITGTSGCSVRKLG